MRCSVRRACKDSKLRPVGDSADSMSMPVLLKSSSRRTSTDLYRKVEGKLREPRPLMFACWRFPLWTAACYASPGSSGPCRCSFGSGRRRRTALFLGTGRDCSSSRCPEADWQQFYNRSNNHSRADSAKPIAINCRHNVKLGMRMLIPLSWSLQKLNNDIPFPAYKNLMCLALGHLMV